MERYARKQHVKVIQACFENGPSSQILFNGRVIGRGGDIIGFDWTSFLGCADKKNRH